MSTSARIRLVDNIDEAGRSTATLLASLAARLGVLHALSGADAIGSLAAGICALGRESARTADGARLAAALRAGRPGRNAERVWSALHIGDWLTSLPASPVLDQQRNDLALLLVADLDETLDLLPIPGESAGGGDGANTVQANPIDYIVGLWALAGELLHSIELLAAPTAVAPGASVDVDPPPAPPAGRILR